MLTCSGITEACRIVKTDHLVCVIYFNDIVAEYIGAEKSIRISAHFAGEPSQRQSRHGLISQLFPREHKGSVFSECQLLSGPLAGTSNIPFIKKRNPQHLRYSFVENSDTRTGVQHHPKRVRSVDACLDVDETICELKGNRRGTDLRDSCGACHGASSEVVAVDR